MVHIDVPTLFIVSATIDIVLGAQLAYVYRTEKTYPGFRDWMLGAVFQATGFVLLVTRLVVPPFISSLCASALLVASAERFLRGVRRYGGQSGRGSVDEIAAYVVSAVAFAYFIFVDYRTSARVVVFSVCLGYICLKAAVFCARHLVGAYRSEGRFLSVLFVLTVGVNVVRGVAAGLFPASVDAELLQRGTEETLPLVAGIALVVCFAGTFLVINGKRLRLDLEAAYAQVRQLEGILPICMYCKKIRDNQNSWLKLERYLTEHSQAQFSHGICPECAQKVDV